MSHSLSYPPESVRFVFNKELFKNSYYTRCVNTSIYGLKLVVKEFDEYIHTGKKNTKSAEKHVHFKTYWACKKRDNLQKKKRVVPEYIAALYKWYSVLYLNRNVEVEQDEQDEQDAVDFQEWKTYFALLKKDVKQWNKDLYENYVVHLDSFDRNHVPNVSFNDFPPTHIYLDTIYKIDYRGIETYLHNANGDYHGARIHIEDIPLKYRYRADNLLFVPDFMEIQLS